MRREVQRTKRYGVYRVIVADDEPPFRLWLRSLLECSGDFEVVGEASSGLEALRLIALLAPDVVIADVHMPDPDGLELARYLQYNFPGIKTIVVSDNHERVYERMAREEGALAFIPKARLSLETVGEALQRGGRL